MKFINTDFNKTLKMREKKQFFCTYHIINVRMINKDDGFFHKTICNELRSFIIKNQ